MLRTADKRLFLGAGLRDILAGGYPDYGRLSGLNPVEALLGSMLADSPVVLWGLQEASAPAQDSTANNNDSTSSTGIAFDFALGPVVGSTCIQAQGGESISRAAVTSATDNFTLEVFFQPVDVLNSNQTVIAVKGSGNGYDLLIDPSMKVRGVAQGVALLDQSSGALVEDQWNHVALARDSGTWKYWMNGAFDATTDTDNPIAPSSATFQLNGSNDMSALYAFAAVYETALSSADLQAHADAGDFVPPTP